MKSRSLCLMLLGTVLSSGCAKARLETAFYRIETSPGSVIASRDAVGPRLAPVGLARRASVETQNAGTIQGYSVSRVATATSSVDEFPPGLIGGLIGAAVGGALGFVWARAHCDNGVCGGLARPTLSAAAVGALLGLFVEWVARSGPDPAPTR
jgi:hypothetical protein